VDFGWHPPCSGPLASRDTLLRPFSVVAVVVMVASFAGASDGQPLADVERRLLSLDYQTARTAREEFNALDQRVRETVAASIAARLRSDAPRTAQENSPGAVLEVLGAAAVPALVELLKDPAVRVRTTAVSVLAMVAKREHLSPLPGEIVPRLAGALHDPISTVRFTAVVALADIGPPAAAAAVPALRQRLVDPEPRIRSAAARALAKLDEGAIPVLLKDLSDANENIRAGAAHALGLFGSRGGAAVPALSAALSDGDPYVRLSAAEALTRIDPSVREIVPALARALEDPHPGIRSASGQAFVRARAPRGRRRSRPDSRPRRPRRERPSPGDPGPGQHRPGSAGRHPRSPGSREGSRPLRADSRVRSAEEDRPRSVRPAASIEAAMRPVPLTPPLMVILVA
jgi:HEAT repeat protein